MKNDMPKTIFWFATLVFAGLATRWVPHPSNFTALLAVALFAPLVLSGPWVLFVPMATAFIGDTLLGFHDLVGVVYLSLLVLTVIGKLVPQQGTASKRWTALFASGFLGAAFFFFTTNLAVWKFSGIYAQTSEGLSQCFLLALPFFSNSLLSTWLFLAGFEVVRQRLPERLGKTAKSAV